MARLKSPGVLLPRLVRCGDQMVDLNNIWECDFRWQDYSQGVELLQFRDSGEGLQVAGALEEMSDRTGTVLVHRSRVALYLVFKDRDTSGARQKFAFFGPEAMLIREYLAWRAPLGSRATAGERAFLPCQLEDLQRACPRFQDELCILIERVRDVPVGDLIERIWAGLPFLSGEQFPGLADLSLTLERGGARRQIDPGKSDSDVFEKGSLWLRPRKRVTALKQRQRRCAACGGTHYDPVF